MGDAGNAVADAPVAGANDAVADAGAASETSQMSYARVDAAQRVKNPIEVRPDRGGLQWVTRVAPLAEPAIEHPSLVQHP